MIQKTGMTIDAYLRNAGIKPVGTMSRRQFIPLKTGTTPSFSEDLNSAISSNPPEAVGEKTGMTISDYLHRATANASGGLFRNSTLLNGSLHPGYLNTFSLIPVPSKGDPTTAAFASQSRSISTDTGVTTPSDGETIVAESIKRAARKYDLPEKLIAGVIRAESNFQADAVSPAGAQGLMQLMPATAKELGVNDPFDVRQNIDGGAGYLRQMLDRFGGDLRLALAAYNAGPGTVEKYNGNVPYRETRNYIERVLKGVSA
ncbi:lytic transglycosylase domain-containing protein [uncultured Desulfosarcina sp.]|uniref:lytic transglycosylase domain-containing protein n=1 Tax=uncultured Desulfosarcina sp. TaxID=218289 RepID=UPI0029C928FA|nr:lytic transglycosylase domain-containing protein [uncultured Desulfosarcina sp.]